MKKSPGNNLQLDDESGNKVTFQSLLISQGRLLNKLRTLIVQKVENEQKQQYNYFSDWNNNELTNDPLDPLPVRSNNVIPPKRLSLGFCNDFQIPSRQKLNPEDNMNCTFVIKEENIKENNITRTTRQDTTLSLFKYTFEEKDDCNHVLENEVKFDDGHLIDPKVSNYNGLELEESSISDDDDFSLFLEDVAGEKQESSMLQGNMLSFESAMGKSFESQQRIHDWDRKMGLKRSHSKTMRLSMRSRKKLRQCMKEDITHISKMIC